MTPLVLRDVSKNDLELFKKIRRTIKELPDVDLDGETVVSCHMVCRALAEHFPATCRDGFFGANSTHSWLVTDKGLIIDAYPWAMVGGPVMVYTGGFSPWATLYREADLSDHFHRLGAAFDKGVASVSEAVRRAVTARKLPRYDF